MLDFAWLGVLNVRRLGTEEFAGEGGRRLLAGNALHGDFSPESPGADACARLDRVAAG